MGLGGKKKKYCLMKLEWGTEKKRCLVKSGYKLEKCYPMGPSYRLKEKRI